MVQTVKEIIKQDSATKLKDSNWPNGYVFNYRKMRSPVVMQEVNLLGILA